MYRSDKTLHFTVNQSKLYLFPFISASLAKPCISSPSKNYTFYAGVSFPSIDIFIHQPHYPITFSPPLPPTIQLVSRNDGLSGYWLTGVWEEEELIELVITARNNRGNDNLHLRIEVLCQCAFFYLFLAMPSLHNQLCVIDTAISNSPPNITISHKNEIIFNRKEFYSSINRIAVTDVFSEDFLVTVCNS